MLAQDSCLALGPTWNVSPNPDAPSKRPRNPVSPDAAPDPKAARVAPTSTSKGVQDFASRHAMTTPTYLITVSDEQVQRAGREPTRGWPSYSALYPEGNPTEVIHDPAFYQKNFWNKDANDGWVTGTAMDPLTAASKAAHTTLVDPGEFRTLGDDASLLRPLVGRDFQVGELPAQKARDGKTCHFWRRGVRLGAAASGVYPQWVSDMDAAPPGC